MQVIEVAFLMMVAPSSREVILILLQPYQELVGTVTLGDKFNDKMICIGFIMSNLICCIV